MLPPQLEEIFKQSKGLDGLADTIIVVSREFPYKIEEILEMPLPRFAALATYLKREEESNQKEINKSKGKKR